ncbi:MAG TPA: hypothetical protein VIH35_09280 [Kiritimatiellia bacterium]|jgi:hypothetical protein
MMRWCVLFAILAGSVFAQEENVDIRVTKAPFSENTLVGENEQPEWTTRRRFPTTRVYVQQPPGAWGLSQWWRMDDSKGEDARHRFRTEAEIGIAKRTQLDLYLDTQRTRDDQWIYHDTAVEIRYALADWGKLPLNPTFYYEWQFVEDEHGPDKHEIKGLFGDAVKDWHYGVNLVYEQEVGEARETEYQISQAVGYSVSDRLLSIGEEAKYAIVSEEGARGEAAHELSVGPSLQLRTSKDSHLDLVALFGVTDDAADIETFFVFGYAFGAETPDGPRAPASARAE